MSIRDDHKGSNFSPMAKRLLLERRLRSATSVPSEPTSTFTIPRRPQHTPAVISFSQQRLWLIDQLYPDNIAYNITGVVSLRGALDIQAIGQSLQVLVQRHEALHTTFSIINDAPVQHIVPTQVFSLPIIDLQNSPSPQQEIERRVQVEARKPFNLTVGPLFRAQLLKCAEREHVLLLTMHHIISDGWSLGIFNQELATLYGAFTQQRPSPLPKLPIQYADFAVWQREWLQKTVLEEQLAYWKKQIAGAPDIVTLPFDYPRPTVQTFQGATITFTIAPQLVRKLQLLCREENATLFMALLATFQLLLARYSGQEDFLVASPIAGRVRPETEELIGFFVNTLVLRADLSADPTFRILLQRVRETSLSAYMHQDLPFERLVEEVQLYRDLSRNPLVQVCFALQNAPMQPLKAGDLTFDMHEIKNGTTPFDVFLEFTETSDGLQGQCTYSTNLFKSESIEKLIIHYQCLLEEIVDNPDRCIWQLSMLSEDERQKLLVTWNATQSSYPQLCIHQIFEIQANNSPDAIAIVYEDYQLTYEQLDLLSTQLAHYLQKFHIKPETLVGICVERSLDIIVCLLGILKAGGAYLPFDPTYPQERLAYMLENAQVPIVLAQRRLLGHLSPCQSQVLCLEEVLPSLKHEVTTPLNYTSSPDTLAYVMYTSGSTGRPKGTAIEHHSVVRLVKNTNYADFSREHVFLQFAPIAFDAATFEIWGPLLNGGRLVVFPTSSSLDELGTVLRHFHITTLWLTAGYFHQLIEEQVLAFHDIRQLLAGGDVLSASHVRLLLQEVPQCKLINGYGPTENTTFTTCYSVPREILNITVPIGRPITNTQVYVLDRHLQLSPIGVPGELYIGGEGLARGYLNYPELTAERFIPDPYSSLPGKRLYKTGDIVRYLSNGQLEFLGRLDHQIKVRGFRVELGEIEMTINQHPAVHDSLVLPYDDQFDTKRLAAYIIESEKKGDTRKPEVLSAENFRTYLKKYLPEYMIPSAFMFLDAWPLTTNGKIDRHALPPVVWNAPEITSEENAPRNETENVLLDIWKEVLGINAISIHDNFFDIGGHSLLAMRMLSRVRNVLHVDIPLRILFEVSTIAELANWIDISQEQTSIDDLHIPSLAGKSTEQILTQLDQLSDEEVEALLDSLTSVNEEKDK